MTELTYPRYRRKLSSRDREKLYDRCRGPNPYPICNIPGCGRYVMPGQKWVESHYPIPFALGGDETGVAHDLCNRLFASRHEVPVIAKAKRGRQKFIGAWVSSRPMPGGRDDNISKGMDGRVRPRGRR